MPCIEQSDFRARVAKLEAACRSKLPVEYRNFLAAHSTEDLPNTFIATNRDYWGVRMLFELAGGELDAQVDRVHWLVEQAIPPGYVPVAEDWSGNLYLLHLEEGAHYGQVVWWNHERDEKNQSVEVVAGSFPEFVSLLRREA